MINVQQVELTDLKSTRNFQTIPRPLQTRHCFKVTDVPCALSASLRKWEDFDTQIGHVRGASLSLNKAMRRVNAVAGPRLSTSASIIGAADLFLCQEYRVIMIGKKVTHLPADFLRCVEEKIDFGIVPHFQTLCHTMFINGIAHGFLYTDERLLFVKLAGSAYLSRPASWSDLIHFCAALSPEPCRVTAEWVPAVPEMVEDPDIIPLSSYEKGSIGRLRWWVAHKTNQRKIQLSFGTNMGGYWQGAVSMESRSKTGSSSSISQAVFKISHIESLVRKSASMIQFLNANHVRCAPTYIVYCHILRNDFHVLALESFGKIVTEDDLTESTLKLMHAALTELHDHEVLLTDFSLESFSLYQSEVKIVDYSHARLCRKVPAIAKEMECKKLSQLTSHASYRPQDSI